MRHLAKNPAKNQDAWGFTLVELLTVIAIIAVLATLLSASLGTAQRKARKAASTSNLRQIALAFNVYLDDQDRRPLTFREMTEAKYLNERVLICPEDRYVKNWAGILEQLDAGRSFVANPQPGRGETSAPGFALPQQDVAHSYFKSFDYPEEIWTQINRSAMGGIAACQLHGIGRQRKDEPPSMDAFQGLVLRALKDGSVISRQVFWQDSSPGTSSLDPGAAPTLDPDSPPNSLIGGSSQLPLFIDPTE